MTLSARSRSSSSSYSFQPKRHSSIRISWTGDISSPRVTIRSKSAACHTMPPPVPPSVYEGRMTTGLKPCPLPSDWATSLASSRLRATRLAAWSRPMRSMRSRKCCRSSVIAIVSMSTPMISMPCSAQNPCSCRRCARLSAVCPPIVGRTASGFSMADDLADRGGRERLEVDLVRRHRVGHDRGRVRVDEHHAVAFVAERAGGLRAGVVELARLPDHDGAGADEQDRLDVGATGHRKRVVKAGGTWQDDAGARPVVPLHPPRVIAHRGGGGHAVRASAIIATKSSKR